MIYLRSHIHFCQLGNVIVFMDIRADRYFSLPEIASAAFTELCAPTGAGLSPQAQSLAVRLEAENVISRDPRLGRPPFEPNTERFKRSIFDLPRDAFSAPGAKDAILLMLSVSDLRLLNRQRGFLPTLLPRLSAWKAEMDLEAQRHQDAIVQAQKFLQLAPWFISSRDACLYRSALLVRYLARRSIPSQLNIGVRAAPFSAHCWVSSNSLVLNDHVETVNEFRPILSV